MFTCYSIYWPNPFRAPTSASNDNSSRGISQPKILYRPVPLTAPVSSPEGVSTHVNGEARDRESETEGADQFELAPMVEEGAGDDLENERDISAAKEVVHQHGSGDKSQV